MPLTAQSIRNASHFLTEFSALMRNEKGPSSTKWEYMLRLYKADDVFQAANDLLEAAEKMEAREKGKGQDGKN